MITDLARRRFEDVWPEVGGRLLRCLVKRGTPVEVAEDVVQETAIRALRTGVPFASADDLLRWSTVVAKRLVIDGHRRARFLADVEPPDVAARERVDQVVEGRLAVEAIGVALRGMTPAQRQALLDTGLGKPLERKEAVRLAVRRHRARAHLRSAVEGLLGALIGLGFRMRRWVNGLSTQIGEVPAVALASFAVLVTGALSPAAAVASPTPDRAQTRVAEAIKAPTLSVAATVPRRAPTALVTSSPATKRATAEVAIAVPAAQPAWAGAWQAPDDRRLACVSVQYQPTCVDSPVMLPAPPVP